MSDPLGSEPVVPAVITAGHSSRASLRLVDHGGCMSGGTHLPSWSRADVAELTDHPRGARHPARVAHGVTVWVTRCGQCEVPLLLVGPWGAGRSGPPACSPPLVLELVGAVLDDDARAALDQGHAPRRPPLPPFPPAPFPPSVGAVGGIGDPGAPARWA
ncbi:hypothetical protein ABT299_45000 [Spirillospora sp. NPDC000708]